MRAAPPNAAVDGDDARACQLHSFDPRIARYTFKGTLYTSTNSEIL